MSSARRFGKRLALSILCATAALPAWAEQIVIRDAFARATAPGQKNGAAYMTIETGGGADALVAGSSTAAAKVELHTHLMDNGVARMRAVDSIPLEPGKPAVLRPGGHHVMLMGLVEPLREGGTVTVTLRFEKAGAQTVTIPVLAPGAGGPAMPPGHGGGHSGK